MVRLSWCTWVMALLAGVENTCADSAKSSLRQQQVQLSQRVHRGLRGAQLHLGASHDIEHASGNHDHDAWSRLKVDYLAGGTLLAVLAPDVTSIQRMLAKTLQLPARHGQNDQVIAMGRKAWLFAGSELTGQRAAAIMSLVRNARLYGHDPYAYLKDVLTRLPSHKRTIRSQNCCAIAGSLDSLNRYSPHHR
jgi:hypothetical protein